MEIFEEIDEASCTKRWWIDRRVKFNIGLAGAGVLAFFCYMIVGVNFIMPFDKEFEITLFTIAFQAVGYFFLMIIANLFYNLGYWADLRFNYSNSDAFRIRLFNIGFWFSFALPFSIPIMLLFQYFREFH